MRILNKTKLLVAVTLAALSTAPLTALASDGDPVFQQWEATQYQQFKSQLFSQLSRDYNALQNAFSTLGKNMHDYFEEANVIGKNAQPSFDDMVRTLNQIPQQLSTAFQDANISGIVQAAQNNAGRVYLNDVTADMKRFEKVHNPTEAVVMAALTDLRNRAKDSTNIVAYLDTAARDYSCKGTGYRCTVLVALQEKVAAEVDALHSSSVSRGAYWLQTEQRRAPADSQYFNLKKIGLGGTAVRLDEDAKPLSAFLSPAPMLAAGFNPATDKGALPVAQALVLSDVLIGATDFGALEDLDNQVYSGNQSLLQTKILTRFARVQLARQAIATVTSNAVQDALTSEFKMCVVRPTEDDLVGSSVQQHLTNVENLLRCTNLSLLHLRRVQMEQSRLIAVLLATQLDHFTFLTAEEETSGKVERGNR